jgi:L-threonylcarbamoyladenylate synthase
MSEPEINGDGEVSAPEVSRDADVGTPEMNGDGEASAPEMNADDEVSAADVGGDGEVGIPEMNGDSEASAPDLGEDGEVSAPEVSGDAEVGAPDLGWDGEVGAPEVSRPPIVSATYDCGNAAGRAEGLAAAALALRSGQLVVLPTDTVYGLAADAFYPSAVASLLAAKGRGRNMPPPVLVGTVRAASALIDDLGPYGKDLIDEFWPGGLTLVCRASRSLNWDLGDTRGTVAVRMPLHAVALDLLKETGPLAVSSANRTGSPAATTAAQAREQLGDAVSVYLDGGPCTADTPSTIVDLTGSVPRLLRAGAVSVGRLREVAALSTASDN